MKKAILNITKVDYLLAFLLPMAQIAHFNGIGQLEKLMLENNSQLSRLPYTVEWNERR